MTADQMARLIRACGLDRLLAEQWRERVAICTESGVSEERAMELADQQIAGVIGGRTNEQDATESRKVFEEVG